MKQLSRCGQCPFHLMNKMESAASLSVCLQRTHSENNHDNKMSAVMLKTRIEMLNISPNTQ